MKNKKQLGKDFVLTYHFWGNEEYAFVQRRIRHKEPVFFVTLLNQDFFDFFMVPLVFRKGVIKDYKNKEINNLLNAVHKALFATAVNR